jgi:hypothetical protein
MDIPLAAGAVLLGALAAFFLTPTGAERLARYTRQYGSGRPSLTRPRSVAGVRILGAVILLLAVFGAIGAVIGTGD